MTTAPAPPRIVLIHATPVAMGPIRAAMSSHWAEAECVDLLDEALSVDRARARDLTPSLSHRIMRLADYATDIGADGILFTCSAFGPAIDRAATVRKPPTLKPNEAMFQAALRHGREIAMLYTFRPARESMEMEFHEEARQQGVAARLTSLYVADAISALQAGDTATHDRLVAEAATDLADFDAVMLAQFSMARAAAPARAACLLPVLSSPEAAVVRLKVCVQDTKADRL